MSESLRNDGRIWVPAKKEDAEAIRAGKLHPNDIAEENRDYYLERRYPAFVTSYLVMLPRVQRRSVVMQATVSTKQVRQFI